MNIDWDHLQYFLILARAKTLTNTAKIIGVEHSTVARRIQALENKLGKKLFKRESTGYELTNDGLELVPRIEQMEKAYLEIDKPLNPLEGRVRIGAPEGFGVAFLTELLVELSQQYPMITIDLIALPKMVKLSHREADIVISIDRPQNGPYIMTRLTDYSLKIYGSKEYLNKSAPIHCLNDLPKHKFVNYISDLVYSPELYCLERVQLPLIANFRSSNIIAQQIAVSCGAGLAILPKFLAERQANLIPILDKQVYFTHTFWMLTLVELQHEPRIKVVWDFLRKKVDDSQSMLLD